MSIRVGINGMGRIGREYLRYAATSTDLDVVAVNDIADSLTIARLLRHDSTFGPFPKDIELSGEALVIDGRKIAVSAVREPSELDWAAYGVEVVIESTGKFRTREAAAAHLTGGAQRVIISAPGKGVDATIVLGVNDDTYDPANHRVISNASCTTNCLAPLAKVLHESFGIKSGWMTTIHSYTNDQQLLDLPHKDLRRARAAALSMIPTTTGAAVAVGEVLPELKGKLDGFAMRVPTPNVSVVDLVAIVNKSTSADEINAALTAAANGPMKGILAVSTEELVSVDFKGNKNSSIVDAAYTKVMDGNFVKVLSWYDNEWGYSNRCVDLLRLLVKKGL